MIRRLRIGLLALLLPLSMSHGFEVSGTVTGQSGFSLVFVYTVPVTLDTFYITLANLFNGNYSQGNLDEGSYFLFAFQDMNINLLPDLDEPRGFYGGDFPQALEVVEDLEDIDIELSAPNTGGFSGTVTYAGEETGATYVFAHRTNSFEGLPSGGGVLFNNTGNGDYTAIVDSFGVYYAYAFMDLNTNLQFDEGEPYDVYGDDLEPEPITIEQGEQFPDEIDFELVATSDVETRPVVIGDFRLGSPYPNPFNAVTTIPFTLSSPMEIELVAHDILGRTAAVIARGHYSAGEHVEQFGHAGLASGLYMIELRAQGMKVCTPAVLVK